jgi:hypothetical protein
MCVPNRRRGERFLKDSQTGSEDATRWCKELKALPFVNLPVTRGVFSTRFSTELLKKIFDGLPYECQRFAKGLSTLGVSPFLCQKLAVSDTRPGTKYLI